MKNDCFGSENKTRAKFELEDLRFNHATLIYFDCKIVLNLSYMKVALLVFNFTIIFEMQIINEESEQVTELLFYKIVNHFNLF